MSAWIVSKTHIDLLVTAGLRFPRHGNLRWNANADPKTWTTAELTHSNADEVGRKLWTENFVSAQDRYPNDKPDELPGPADFDGPEILTYRFEEIPGRIDPVTVLHNIACYEYQTCEHDGWHASEARRIAEAIRDAAIGALPGYDKQPWGFDDRRYFLERADA